VDEAERTKILELLADGLSSEEIARRLGVPKMRAAAVKAHMTMGRYEGALGAEEAEALVEAADLKFGLERDMQSALRRHIDQLDPRLTIVDEGKERHVEAGFIDILAEDDEGALVVIELKSGAAPDSAITQVLSYIGSLQTLEPGRAVRGILIAREFSTRVRFAAQAAGIRLVTYGYNFTFARVGEAAGAISSS
jgi:RecB family endonuclease NucS